MSSPFTMFPSLPRLVLFANIQWAGIKVKEVLRAVPMSRTLLERRFQRTFGPTPGAHILKMRLEQVKTLLTTTGLSVGAIAERTGFAHSEYLTVAFRRETGSTPMSYRAAHHAMP